MKFFSRQSSFASRRASILLEVVLALGLFAGAATVIALGINASVQAVYRLRLNTHASNLAISVMSEMQMQVRPVATLGPEAFLPPFGSWTYQIVVAPLEESPLEADALQSVEVIVRHSEEGIAQRLTHLFRSSDITSASGDTPSAAEFRGGGL